MTPRRPGTRGRLRWEAIALALLGLYVASGLVERHWFRSRISTSVPSGSGPALPKPPSLSLPKNEPPKSSRELGQVFFERCVSKVPPVEQVIHIVNTPGFPSDPTLQTAASRWLSCTALGRRDASLCAMGKPQKAPGRPPPGGYDTSTSKDLEPDCRRFFTEGVWLASAVAQKPNQGACESMMKLLGTTELFSRQRLPDACRWVSEHIAKRESPSDYPCEDLGTTGLMTSGQSNWDLRVKGGCYRLLLHCQHSGVQSYWAPGCQEALRLWLALSSGSSACSALPECSALSSGSSSPCDALERELVAAYCRAATKQLLGGST